LGSLPEGILKDDYQDAFLRSSFIKALDTVMAAGAMTDSSILKRES